MKKGEIWRFLSPIFLHGGFGHITMNLFSNLFWGSMLEAMAGFKHTAAIYFASG